jgi:hypothetical protein
MALHFAGWQLFNPADCLREISTRPSGENTIDGVFMVSVRGQPLLGDLSFAKFSRNACFCLTHHFRGFSVLIAQYFEN